MNGLRTTYRVAFFVAFLILYAHSFVYASAVENRINIEVDLVSEKKNNYTMKINFRNISDKPLAMYEWDLPWNSVTTLLMIATSADSISRSPLKRYYEISDPYFKTIVIEPKNYVEGQIDLQNIFPDLYNSRVPF